MSDTQVDTQAVDCGVDGCDIPIQHDHQVIVEVSPDGQQELTDHEMIQQIHAIMMQFGQMMEAALPMVEKISKHPMLAPFLS